LRLKKYVSNPDPNDIIYLINLNKVINIYNL